MSLIASAPRLGPSQAVHLRAFTPFEFVPDVKNRRPQESKWHAHEFFRDDLYARESAQLFSPQAFPRPEFFGEITQKLRIPRHQTPLGTGNERGHFVHVQARRTGNQPKWSSAEVNVASSGASTGLESVFLTATKKAESPQGATSNEKAAFGPLGAANRVMGQISATAAPIIASKSPALLIGIGVGTAGLLAAVGSAVMKSLSSRERTVDALARRGFISSDRSVPLQVIGEFEDPTQVKNYQLGNAQLVELEPLAPLSAEKIVAHREQRRREHGWKKPDLVLVEGEPIPDGVDPLAVRFIPKKHPFALNSEDAEEDFNEDVARRRLRQRRGRPEKEQQRSRQQLERLRRDMDTRESSMDPPTARGGPPTNRNGVLPSIDD